MPSPKKAARNAKPVPTPKPITNPTPRSNSSVVAESQRLTAMGSTYGLKGGRRDLTTRNPNLATYAKTKIAEMTTPKKLPTAKSRYKGGPTKPKVR
jgi:hypothetical protein